MHSFVRFFLDHKLVSILLLCGILLGGVAVSPFDWETGGIPRNPVPVDAIPDLGENQQIVFTSWSGRSPQDVEDQVTYPLTTALLGIPGVRTIRSSSLFGASNIYVIFEEGVDFYWSRSRILEKLNALPAGLLPEEVQPSLGPDATALGQVFWYSIEGQDSTGKTTGGWDLQELRTIQDFNVKLALGSTPGVAEVASIGGHVLEFHVDVDPVALERYDLTLQQVMSAIRSSNKEVGASTMEINRAEYFVRGLGYLKSTSDLASTVIKMQGQVPVRIADVAEVSTGPAARRGVLDRGGAEAVGGVVVARYGANPMEVINSVKEKIKLIAPGLPEKTLEDGRKSKLTIVPFYDRTGLIQETLGTLNETLSLELLITLIVVIVMVMNLRASLIISSVLPLSILGCFIAMRAAGVDANIVALSGIAIAIGTMVDIGVILTENILSHLAVKDAAKSAKEAIVAATAEVLPAVLTAVGTTVVSFLPVFTLMHAEGKLFRPLAFTKTFALISAVGVAMLLVPLIAHILYKSGLERQRGRTLLNVLAILLGIAGAMLQSSLWLWLIPAGLVGIVVPRLKLIKKTVREPLVALLFAGLAAVVLGLVWEPLGPAGAPWQQTLFTLVVVGSVLGGFYVFQRHYETLLTWCLRRKRTFMLLPLSLVVLGVFCWIGAAQLFGVSEDRVAHSKIWSALDDAFPGLSSEFMPSLDEGSFLLMPTSMPHAGMQENQEVLAQLDMAVSQIPEVTEVVGKLGRIESALDPAPISMYENIIHYAPEYAQDAHGKRIRFKVDSNGTFVRDQQNALIPDPNGAYFRNWRPHIQSPEDIWKEIQKVELPGVTAAPKLQPIETRLVMLQSGMRSPMGIKVNGPDLPTIEQFGLQLERILKGVKGVKRETVFAERMVGKPYLTVVPDRQLLAQYGLTLEQLNSVVQMAVGGMKASTFIAGRERYAIRVRYPREWRSAPDEIAAIQIPLPSGGRIALDQLASVDFVKGPQMIRSENTFLQGYVLFDRMGDFSENDVVHHAQSAIEGLIAQGKLRVPAGVSFEFAGNYQNQLRAEKRLRLVIPISLGIILLILYLQFGSVRVAAMIFSSVAVAFAGGFILLWLYSKPGFMDLELGTWHLREMFQIEPVHLSVAVWVGFLALFGIATDDGVVMGTYLNQEFIRQQPTSVAAIRSATLTAGSRRIRPCLMTTATTLLALFPILTSTGKGSDIMVPMAIPAVGGMTIALITLFVIPVLFCWQAELALKKHAS